jgi:hypothetical protein
MYFVDHPSPYFFASYRGQSVRVAVRPRPRPWFR